MDKLVHFSYKHIEITLHFTLKFSMYLVFNYKVFNICLILVY
jgi:hypothetical protein